MEQLSELPPLALAFFGVTVAIIFCVRYLGLLSGEKAPPEKSHTQAQVAAVIVDPTALNRVSSTGEALNMTLIKLCSMLEEKIRVETTMAIELDRIREELRIQREINRRER